MSEQFNCPSRLSFYVKVTNNWILKDQNSKKEAGEIITEKKFEPRYENGHVI